MSLEQHCTAALAQHYGLTAALRPLHGDVDANFLATTSVGQQLVCKLMHEGCELTEVDVQCAVLHHIEDLDLGLPRVVSALDGTDSRVIAIDGTNRILWLLTYCEGTLLAQYTQRDADLYNSFGHALACLDRRLADFDHPHLPRAHRWCLTSATDCEPLAACVVHQSDRRRVEAGFARFSQLAVKLSGLPHNAIHNDANDHNVVVGSDGRVEGLFDFGDMAYQPRVCDPAIALAYLVLDTHEPLSACESFLRGYQSVLPLQRAEIELLWPLLVTRLCVSVAISSDRQQREPNNEYIVISQTPALRALSVLESIGEEVATRALLRAAGY